MTHTFRRGFLCILGALSLLSASSENKIIIGSKPIPKLTIEELRNSSRSYSNISKTRIVAQVNSDFDASILSGTPWKVLLHKGSIAIFEGPEFTRGVFSTIPGVISYRKPVPIKRRMDAARAKTYTDSVHVHLKTLSNSSIKGNGVIVGIVDSDFDLRHESFIDKNGNTRFLALWDQTEDTSGYASHTYANVNLGVELRQSELKSNLDFGNGEIGHGSHVASIAAGSDNDAGYGGIAPEADIIGVKLNMPEMEDYDISDFVYGSSDISSDVDIILAVDWIFTLADSLNRPCVVNLSLGSHMGPHDGTGFFDKYVDEAVKAGHIVVGAAGNEGEYEIHATMSLTDTELNLPFSSWDDMISGGLEFWGERDSDFEVQLKISTSGESPYLSNWISSSVSLDANVDTLVLGQDSIIVVVRSASEFGPNKRPLIDLFFDQITSNKKYEASISIKGGGTIHAWDDFWSLDADAISDSRFNISTETTVGEIGGTGKNVISVGAYTSKTIVTNYLNKTFDATDLYGLGSGSTIDDIAEFSSLGPTIDGRMKPDICAPGHVVVASCGSLMDTLFYSENIISWQDINSLESRYIAMSGTSMAAPVVTGVIALMLQANPNLTTDKIKEILSETSIKDSFVGTGNDNTWGAGKVNAYGAVQKAIESTPISGFAMSGLKQPLGKFSIVNRTLSYKGEAIPPISEIVLFSLSGRELTHFKADSKSAQQIPINLGSSVFIAAIKLKNGNIVRQQKMVMAK